MRMRVHPDETGHSRIHYQLEPGDLPVSGHASDGRHTTFYTKQDTSFSVRSVSGDDAFEFSAVLLCVSALSVAMFAVDTSGIPAAKNVFFAFMFLAILFLLSIRGLMNEERVGKELLFVAATGIMLVVADAGIPPILLALLFVPLAFYYAQLWRARALWEPVVAFLPFSVVIILYLYGFLPHWLVQPLFAILAAFGLVGFFRIQVDAAQYERAWGRMTEY